MAAPSDTTQREEDSADRAPSSQMWLRWVFPSGAPAVPLEHGLVIGRDGECKVRLGGEGVSRRHLEIHRQGPIFALKDLSSTNGTFLNGKRVQHGAVVPGAVLRIGTHVGVFMQCIGAPREFRQLAAGLLGGQEVHAALAPMQRAAKSDIPIVLVGATGTGKERVARAIHELSGRRGSFQALNCAALPKDLAEAELFGFRKGAFTGADRASLGHFRAADRGTLFLDEVAELPLSLQAKLLRVLEEHAVTPLGETEAVPVDIRVVAAAQGPLADLVSAKLFREDLLARLAALTIRLPPLRDRIADVPPLFEHFIGYYSGGRPPKIEARLIECLCLYEWPSNVRELEQLARQLLAVYGLEPTLKRSLLPREVLSVVPSRESSILPPSPEFAERRDHDLRHLAVALRQAAGNVTAAAALMGVSRQRAYRLLNGTTVGEFVDRELSIEKSEPPRRPGAESA